MSQAAAVISKLVQQAIAGTVDAGAVSVMLPQELGVRVVRESDHLHITWDPNPEVAIVGKPDLLELRVYPECTQAVAWFGTIEIPHK